MRDPRALALRLAIVVLGSSRISLHSQTAPQQTPPAQFAVSLAAEKNHFAFGQKPLAILTLRNLTDRETCLLADDSPRIQIEGKDGQPSKTEYYRHLLGDFRSGDGPSLGSGPVVCQSIAPGKSDTWRFDLSRYYDLSAPGKYSVYIEVESPSMTGPKIRLRTNTVQFEITASAQ